jgi:phosphoribosylaminoimidazole-succinocarboxamide synthase
MLPVCLPSCDTSRPVRVRTACEPSAFFREQIVDRFPVLISCEDLGLAPDRKGKVREIFDLGEELLLVATDRISAFDVVMNQAVPGRGALLTQMTLAWYDFFGDRLPNHLVHADAKRLPARFSEHAARLDGRIMLVHKADRYDIEAVVRGYLAGSGYKDYLSTGAVCGHALPEGLSRCQELPDPIFTPATKADEGHDENISEERAAEIIGEEAMRAVRDKSLQVYSEARAYAREHGIIIADTKFEFGLVGAKLTIIDEMLTPDSSRFWDAEKYEPGREQDSMDKQILRNYLETLDWNRQYPPPELDESVLARVAEGYVEIFHRLFPDRAKEIGL